MNTCEICDKKWCVHLMNISQRKAMFARKRKFAEESVVSDSRKYIYINAYERFIQNGNKICQGSWSLLPQELAFKNYKKNHKQDSNAQVN